jgi:hypothetical protein
MMTLISFALFCVSALIPAAESISERDWPSDTAKFPMIFGACTVVCFFTGL